MEKDIMIRELKAELRLSKRLYLKSLQNNFQKDMKIAHLEKMLKNAGNDADPPQPQPLFANFSMHFHPRQLASLRSMSVEKRADASFVRTCLEYIYDDDLDVLQKKSAHGAPKRKVNKANGVVIEIPETEPISPEKYTLLKSIFAERISAVDASEIIREGRKGKLNTLIGKSIGNIRSKNSNQK